MGMEFLFLGNEGDVAEDAVTSLLIQRRQDTIIVRFRVAEPLARQHFLNTREESNHVNTLPLASPCRPPATSHLQHQCGWGCGSSSPQERDLFVPLPSLYFSLAFLFSNSLFSSPPHVPFSSLLVPVFLNLCFGVCPSLSVYWLVSVGLCLLKTYMSLRAELSLDVYLDVCTYVTLSFL